MKNWPGLARLARLPGWSCSWLGLCRWQSELDRPLDEQLTTAIAISNQASTGRRVRHSARDMSSSVACIQMQIHSQQQQIQIHVQAAVAVTDTALSLFAVVSVFVSVSAALAVSVSVLSLVRHSARDSSSVSLPTLSSSHPLRPLQTL